MGEDLASFLLQSILLPLPGQIPLEMALDFTAIHWESTSHHISVVAKTYPCAGLLPSIAIAHAFTEEETEAVRVTERPQSMAPSPEGRICFQGDHIWILGSYPSF